MKLADGPQPGTLPQWSLLLLQLRLSRANSDHPPEQTERTPPFSPGWVGGWVGVQRRLFIHSANIFQSPLWACLLLRAGETEMVSVWVSPKRGCVEATG